MKRSLKNIIMIIIIVLMIGAIYLTINSNSSSIPNGNPPSMPPGENNGTPPPKPEENDNIADDIALNTTDNPDNNQTSPDMSKSSSSTSTITYVLLGVESLVIASTGMYLVLSGFNKKSFKETMADKNKIVIGGLATVIITGGVTYLCTTFIGSNNGHSMPNGSGPGSSGNSSSITYQASKEITSDEEITSGEYSSTNALENAISISNAKATLSGITVTKTGDSDGGDSTSFYGNNSAILAKDGAEVTITNATIIANANGANGVFSYGGSATTNNSNTDGTTVNISNSKITTTGDNAGGIMTTGGGIMNATNLQISTSGRSSAAIRSDRGGGVVTVDGGTYKTEGIGSPVIYSTADITVKNATLLSTSSEGAIIEGKNSITLENVNLTDTNNKLNGQSTTYKNVFLYQSMSGDAATGKAVFTAKDSTITTNKGDSFYVTNTIAEINLENNKIINNDSNGYFLRIQKDSWGNSGSNGGNVTLNMTNQNVNGNIYVDSISKLTMNMDNSSFEGAINKDNTAKFISLKLDSKSTIKLTSDSYITSLEDEDTNYSNIDFNGYKLYVNGKAIN